MLAKISELLLVHAYVHVVSFDYSKAFDTISHSAVAEKLLLLDIPDSDYNWIINFLDGRKHFTFFKGSKSSFASINASIVQG